MDNKDKMKEVLIELYLYGSRTMKDLKKHPPVGMTLDDVFMGLREGMSNNLIRLNNKLEFYIQKEFLDVINDFID